MPRESLKSVAGRLAQAASGADALAALRILRAGGLLSGPNLAPLFGNGQPDIGSDGAARVGIWERRPGTLHFSRRKDLAEEWQWWASVARIEPKRGRRVVLLGESVARGYLYDPRFTPAHALGHILRARAAAPAVDVVDLAKTNLLLFEFKQLAAEALALDPDVVVVFVGNNWAAAVLDMAIRHYRAEVAAAVRDGGSLALKALVEQQWESVVRQTVNDVAEMYRAHGVPVVWIVPEFCLGDWRDPPTNAALLDPERHRDWLAHLALARDALSRNEIDEAARHASEMLECDGGTNAAAFQILAACCERTGDWSAARAHFESARDCQTWSPVPRTPRSHAIVQRVLREQADGARSIVVDLPELFAGLLDGRLPDRQLFLDYCHLTVKGIEIAMTAAGAAVLRMLDDVDLDWRELSAASPTPDRDVHAEGLFLAAIHCAHWGQSPALVRYYCHEAVRIAPEIVPAMRKFVEIQSRRAPTWMCRAAEEIAALPFPAIRAYLLRHNAQLLDPELLEAMVSCVPSTGDDDHARLQALRCEEHSIRRKKVSLLEPYYYLTIPHEFEQRGAWEDDAVDGRTPSHAYYRAYSRSSRFLFVGEAGQPIGLVLTARLARGAGASPIAISINGRVHRAQLTRHWHRLELADVAIDGLNEVTLQWPVLTDDGASRERCADALLAGMTPDFYSVFGEIHSFTVLPQPLEPATSGGPHG